MRTSPSYAIRINDLQFPLLELQSLVASTIPVGLRNTSENGREFYSKYFIVESPDNYKPAAEATERYTATYIVLGDGRPYDIEISVSHEKRVLQGQNFDYVSTGYDKRLANELANKLRYQLTKRREDRNIIDDFRVF
jgi:hypothetical protein